MLCAPRAQEQPEQVQLLPQQVPRRQQEPRAQGQGHARLHSQPAAKPVLQKVSQQCAVPAVLLFACLYAHFQGAPAFKAPSYQPSLLSGTMYE